MQTKHIVAIVVVLVALSFIPYFWGKKLPEGEKVTTQEVFNQILGTEQVDTEAKVETKEASTKVETGGASSQTIQSNVDTPVSNRETTVAQPKTTLPTTVQTPTPTVTPTAVSVSISGFVFNSADLTVKKGTTVNWKNNDSVPHTVTSDGGSFGSDTLTTGATFSSTFNTIGTFSYHCAFHPSMRATVTVTD